MTGYAHADYAAALAEFGTPHHLPRSDGWILKRPIPDAAARDAMGPYPLFACHDWSQLSVDFMDLGNQLVSLVLVADPFGDYQSSDLKGAFPDLCVPFKQHFVVDLQQPLSASVSRHHQRNARKAMQNLEVEACRNPPSLAAEWCGLYANLIKRHQITGLAAFSPQSLAQQLRVPGLEMFVARRDAEVLGIVLWYTQDEIAYYHLAAYSERGYAMRTSFALFWRALEHFAAKGLHYANLGAGAGLNIDGADGLTRFKSGWATTTRTAYLCGRIFDRPRYDELAHARGATGRDYFPAYRKGVN